MTIQVNELLKFHFYSSSSSSKIKRSNSSILKTLKFESAISFNEYNKAFQLNVYLVNYYMAISH